MVSEKWFNISILRSVFRILTVFYQRVDLHDRNLGRTRMANEAKVWEAS